jgi:hypothetical protein
MTLDEIVRLGAVDSTFFAHYWFPRAFRVESPSKHKEIWNALDDPRYPFVNLRSFRGSAKTTIARTFLAKRISYAVSRTILVVGVRSEAAARTINWLRNNVERNTRWAQAFGLKPGRKWGENECEILHGAAEEVIWVLGVGITGDVRGINFDDYRPDLIVLDDPLNEENVLTKEQRQKNWDLINGALRNSLRSREEEPNAKLAFLQTVLHAEDAAARASASDAWKTVVFTCWSDETSDLPTEWQESSWPQMYSTALLRRDKLSALADNSYSNWSREWECKLVNPELASFRSEWLQHGTPPSHGTRILVIDPVPPPSEREIEKSLHGKDYECIMVVGRAAGKYYCVEYRTNRGHDPNWTTATALELAHAHRVARIVVESVGYQRAIGHYLRQEMARRRAYFAIFPWPVAGAPKVSKNNRIVNSLAGLGAMGMLFCSANHTELIAQFREHPQVPHDDVLDAFSIGVSSLTNPALELGDGDVIELDESEYEKLPEMRRCP